MQISKWLAIAIAGVGTSCAIGAPPGFSDGTRWTFPLIDPLDDGLLVTPVYVKGQGPFLFAIDPDANVTVIDERVAIAAHLMIDRGYSTRLWGEDGERRIRFNAELRDLQVGNLYVETRRAVVVPHETLSASGRPIMGVLGRNVIADSLVFGFDRDRGVAWLQVASTFTPPAGATTLSYSPTSTYTPMASPLPLNNFDEPDEPNTPSRSAYDGRAGVTDNKAELPFVHARIDGRDNVLSVQLGSAITRLRSAAAAGPAKTAIEYDATGARRTLGVTGTVRAEVAGAVNDHVAVARYVDRTELPSNARFFDGTLGLDFFAPFDVVADWPRHAYYLVPRDSSPQLALRLGRWSSLARCAHPGCVTATVATPSAPAASAPPSDVDAFAPAAPLESAAPSVFVLHVTRDPEAAMPLEIRLRARGHSDAPDLVVELPAGVRDVLAPLHDGAAYDVIDASPFAATCPNDGGCVITAR
ncbi:MAG TPA: aspartyl protease family protein [Kofleriaceae bacterium]|jgi:hypothetical protein|nr:aspartyl protease family protein [Kofleriaceae bacterium]